MNVNVTFHATWRAFILTAEINIPKIRLMYFLDSSILVLKTGVLIEDFKVTHPTPRGSGKDVFLGRFLI